MARLALALAALVAAAAGSDEAQPPRLRGAVQDQAPAGDASPAPAAPSAAGTQTGTAEADLLENKNSTSLISTEIDLSEHAALTSSLGRDVCARARAAGSFCQGTTAVQCCASYRGHLLTGVWHCGTTQGGCSYSPIVVVTAGQNQTSEEGADVEGSAPSVLSVVDNQTTAAYLQPELISERNSTAPTELALDLSEHPTLTSSRGGFCSEAGTAGAFCQGTTLVKCCASVRGHITRDVWPCGEVQGGCSASPVVIVTAGGGGEAPAAGAGDAGDAVSVLSAVDAKTGRAQADLELMGAQNATGRAPPGRPRLTLASARDGFCARRPNGGSYCAGTTLMRCCSIYSNDGWFVLGSRQCGMVPGGCGTSPIVIMTAVQNPTSPTQAGASEPAPCALSVIDKKVDTLGELNSTR